MYEAHIFTFLQVTLESYLTSNHCILRRINYLY